MVTWFIVAVKTCSDPKMYEAVAGTWHNVLG